MDRWTPDYSYEQFQKHRDSLSAAVGTNEATTRLRAIDVMLFDILGWDRKDIDAERYVRDEGYADYALQHDNTTLGVVEAKREGSTFVLEGAEYSESPVSFALLSSESKNARKAMAQAVPYAASIGAGYVAITNGHQYIITLTFVPGVPLEQRSVLVFESLDAIASRFRIFHDSLSPSGILGNKLASKLIESRRAPAPAKLSVAIADYPKPANRNVLANEIGWVLRSVWDKTNEKQVDEAFLRRCYVIPQANKVLLAEAAEIIEQRSRIDERTTSKPSGIPGKSRGRGRRASERTGPHTVHPQSEAANIVAVSRPQSPIIVLGRIGHGKSTFLDYLRLIEAKAQLANYMQIKIDFLDRPATASEVQRYVFRSFDLQIRESYGKDIEEAKFARAALNSELRRFRQSVPGSRHKSGSPEQQKAEDDYIQSLQADRHDYLTAVVRHLRNSEHKSLTIVFDNLDRRDDTVQEQAFLQASALARDWEALIFVCLRPGTFYQSAGVGTLDAIAPRNIVVVPPRPDIVLKKRFDLASEVAKGETIDVQELCSTAFGKNISAELPTAADFFECCRDSFARSRNLTEVFAAASNGDMRLLLRFVRDFLTSQHLNTKKITEKIRGSGYLLAPHEAIRALLFGDYEHYDPNRSVFPNIFDIDHRDGTEHFAKLLALRFLARQHDTSARHGFVPRRHVVEYLCQLGYGQDTAMAGVDRLMTSECIESHLGEANGILDRDDVRITPLGRFVSSTLVGTFAYADAVIVDTPITDDSLRAKLKDERGIRERITRCQLFKDYLDECSSGLRDEDAASCWATVSSSLQENIDLVTERFEASH